MNAAKAREIATNVQKGRYFEEVSRILNEIDKASQRGEFTITEDTKLRGESLDKAIKFFTKDGYHVETHLVGKIATYLFISWD